MTGTRVPYGKTHLLVNLPDRFVVEVIAPRNVPPMPDAQDTIRQALERPLGPLVDYRSARTAAVAISDKTRPTPPVAIHALLDWLAGLGLPPQAVTLLLATGTHAPMLPEEFAKVLPGNVLSRCPVRSHDCDDAAALVHLGRTARGTEVWANRTLMDADLRIVVGNIEPHQFMGWSGGVKSAAVGLAGRATINHNHAMMVDPCAALAHYDDNPVRQDVEEIGRLMGVHFALNTILNREKQVAHVLAGEPAAVMRAGIPLAHTIFEVPVAAPFDLVITSPGGHPKDINLYQAQKALAHAARVTREGGAAILVAACPEGTGSARYERWIEGMVSHEAVLKRFAREEFSLGPHKAVQIARDAIRLKHTILVSEMPPDQVRGLLLTPAATVEQALALVLPDLPHQARIGILPAATATVPGLAG